MRSSPPSNAGTKCWNQSTSGGDSGGSDSGGEGSSFGSYDLAASSKLLKTSSLAHTSALTSAQAAIPKAFGGRGAEDDTAPTTPAFPHSSPLTQTEQALARARAAERSIEKPGASTTPEFEGARWEEASTAAANPSGKPTITWSFATNPASASDPFSTYLSTAYQATVEKAIQAWATASGLTFTQVADSGSSDIRIGWGDFATAETGILGLTTFKRANGAFQPGVVVRLEDPSLASLVSSANGQMKYAGTNATLYQVALHEIGHALGLADDSDKSSVMFASSSKANRTLDATDIKGIESLYGSTTSGLHSLSASPSRAIASTAPEHTGVIQLIQAMATFVPQQSIAPLTAVIAPAESAPTLGAPAKR